MVNNLRGYTPHRWSVSKFTAQCPTHSMTICGDFKKEQNPEISPTSLLQQVTELSQCYEAAWMGGQFGREWSHVWLSPFAMHLKLSQHCSSALLKKKKTKIKELC